MNLKLHRNNLLLLLGYALLIELIGLANGRDAAMIVLIFMMIAVAAHFGGLLLGALIILLNGEAPKAGQWALSALLVGVIGFGLCWGGASVAEGINGSASFH